MGKSKMWVEKYRPTSIDQYVFKDKNLKTFIDHCITTKDFPHMLLSGVPGTGKTTIANLLIKHTGVLPEDVCVINASDENSVNVVRDVIKTFATTYPMGEFKVVVLEEADRLTIDAQGALKMIMETCADNLRFIFTSNRDYKIIPALKSRMQHFVFQSQDPNDIEEYVATILIQENITFNIETLDMFIHLGYPDIRKIVHLVQQHSTTGTLIIPTETETSSDFVIKFVDLIQKGQWLDVRSLLCLSVTSDGWDEVYRTLYTKIHLNPAFAYDKLWDDAIIIIGEHLYRHALVADPEINASAMISRINQLQKG